MKIFKIFICALTCSVILSGCEKPAEDASAAAHKAYAEFLSGDISLFDSEDISKWALDVWENTVLPHGELEYTYLDLDGDGIEELLVQYAGSPAEYNVVFHYDSGRLYCWQNDFSEGNCRDYPLSGGTMVRQYDFGGSRTYTLFRYNSGGETEEISSLFAREEPFILDSTDPCPYYEVNGNEVDKTEFDEQLNNTVTSQMLERSAWLIQYYEK